MSEPQFFNLSIPFEDRKEEILSLVNECSSDELYKKFAKKQKINLRNEEDYPIYEDQINSIIQNIFKCKNCDGTLFNQCHHFQNQNNINLLKQFLSNLKNQFDKIQFEIPQNSENDNFSNLGKKRNGDDIFNQNDEDKKIESRVLKKENVIKKYLNSKSVLFDIGSKNKKYNQTFIFAVLKHAPLISVKLVICSKFQSSTIDKLELQLYHQGDKNVIYIFYNNLVDFIR